MILQDSLESGAGYLHVFEWSSLGLGISGSSLKKGSLLKGRVSPGQTQTLSCQVGVWVSLDISGCFRVRNSIFSWFHIGPVAQWIRHRPTEPGIVGSSPTGVIFEVSCADKDVKV